MNWNDAASVVVVALFTLFEGDRVMRWTTVGVLIVALTSPKVWAEEGKKRAFTFTKDDIGKLPAGWKAEKTGKGEGSIWKVVKDDTAPSKSGYALAQTAEGPSSLFNVCVKEDGKYKDVELSVSFKAIAGKKDQGGGFVWRYQDPNNYYICRMNPLESNYRVYKVVNGRRSAEFQDAEVNVPVGEWHRLKVKMKGDHIECFLDGRKVLDVRDSTFLQAGQVGLWTKADAQTYFDNFTVIGTKE
jgi:hypothetical protein